jgi:hypothetical protein
MAHINLDNDLPGIRGLMAYSPQTEKPLNALAEVLLRNDDNTLTRGERELIGTYVSYLNDCFFCQNVHGALAGHYLNCDITQIDEIKRDFRSAALSPKMQALLGIAGSVQKGGKAVTTDQIKDANLLQPRSACLIVTLMGWVRGRQRIESFTQIVHLNELRKVTCQVFINESVDDIRSRELMTSFTSSLIFFHLIPILP